MSDEIVTQSHKKSTIIKNGSDKPKSEKDRHYVSNPALYQAFLGWYADIKRCEELGKPEPVMPNAIGLAFIQIATNLAKKANWLPNTKIKQDMIGDAIINCCLYARNFNPEVTQNPFAYFTQTCYYAFLRRIKQEKKEDYVKHKSMINALTNRDMSEYMDEDNSEQVLEMFDYNQEGIENFIKDFEEKNFGEALTQDSIAGIAGKRRTIDSKSDSDDIGFL